MTVRVLLFASYADAIGSSEVALELADGSVAGDVVTHIRGLAGTHVLPPAPMLAVNAAFAKAGHRLNHGDEVAIIPPVAGG